jgi:HK97 family phage major capsid protein
MLTAAELKQKTEDLNRAYNEARDESLSAETRKNALEAGRELRREIDNDIVEHRQADEAAESEARAEAERIAHPVTADPPEAPAPEKSWGERFMEWKSAGAPGTFRTVVLPDYEYDLRAAGNKRAQVDYRYMGETVDPARQPSIEGMDWRSFQYIQKRTAQDIERRTDIVTTDAATVYSSYIVPSRTQKSLSWHENAASGIIKAGPTIVPTPDDNVLYYPKFITDATATHHDEAAQATVTNPVLGRMQLNAYRYDGYFSVSTEQIRSSILPINGILRDAADRAIATAEAAAFATGSGSDLPQGLAGSTTTTTAGTTASAATSFTMDNLKALKNSVLPGYRSNATWVFGTNAYGLLDTLKDGEGQYLWKPSNIAGEANALLGFPVFEDAGLPDITSATKGSVLFGDFSYYIIRPAGPVVFEANESFQYDKFLTTFRFAKWVDADLLDTAAVKHLLMAT